MARAGGGTGSGKVRLVELRGVEAGFPFYGALELAGRRAVLARAASRTTACWCSRSCSRSSSVAVGDALKLAGQAVHDSRRGHARPRAAVGRHRVRPARLRRSRRPARRRRCWASAAARPISCSCASTRRRSIGSRSSSRREFRRDIVTVRSWRGARRSARREPDDRGELPEPRRVRDRRARRHRRLERHARGRAAEDPERRDPQVPRRDVGAGARDLRAAGAVARRRRQPARRRRSRRPASRRFRTALLEPLGVTSVGVTLSAAAQGVAVGLLVSLLFALVPLLEVRRVKPLLLLRADTATTARRRDWQSWLAGVAVVVGARARRGLAGRARCAPGCSSPAASRSSALALLGVSRAARARPSAASRGRRGSRCATRCSASGGPGNQTRVILMSVGLGCFFVLGVRALQSESARRVHGRSSGATSPDLVLIDIQRDQVDGVRAAVAPLRRRRRRA